MPITERETIEQALNTKFEGAVRNICFLTLPNGKAAWRFSNSVSPQGRQGLGNWGRR